MAASAPRARRSTCSATTRSAGRAAEGDLLRKGLRRVELRQGLGLFTRFLQDYDGNLPNHWAVVRARGARPHSPIAAPDASPSPVRAATFPAAPRRRHSRLGAVCPHVQRSPQRPHRTAVVPQGSYLLYIPRNSNTAAPRPRRSSRSSSPCPTGRAARLAREDADRDLLQRG